LIEDGVGGLGGLENERARRPAGRRGSGELEDTIKRVGA
jgi:hypothetical protein